MTENHSSNSSPTAATDDSAPKHALCAALFAARPARDKPPDFTAGQPSERRYVIATE